MCAVCGFGTHVCQLHSCVKFNNAGYVTAEGLEIYIHFII